MTTWYNRATQQTLDDVFEAAYDPTVCGFKKMELPRKAKLSYTTVHNLRTGKTRDPRFSTVLKLCRAVGMDPELAREQLGVRLSHLRVVRA